MDQLKLSKFENSSMHLKYLNESLKILFNFYHKAKIFDLDTAQLCANECAKIIQNPALDGEETKQNAVNLLAVMPSTLPQLCPKLGEKEENEFVQEGFNMNFVNSLLRTFEEQIDKV